MPVSALSQPKINDALEAVYRSDVAALAVWFAESGDINQTSNNENALLMLASKIGDKKMLDYLITQNPEINTQNKAGSTALMIAANTGTPM